MAHLLTGVRLVLAVPAALAFARPALMGAGWLLALLVVAIASDFLDGMAARRAGTASPVGRLFDHTTDFLFVTLGLAGAAAAGLVPVVLPILVVVAFTQYVIDSYFLHRAKQLRMSALGRWNGILYFVPLVTIAVARLDFLSALAAPLVTTVVALSWLLVLSTVASIIDRAIAPRGRSPVTG